MSRRAFLEQLVLEARAAFARVLRRLARAIDGYPVEYMLPVRGGDGGSYSQLAPQRRRPAPH